ncbi:MAG TPA: outer membrane protein assembly factor BamD [Vicinamibacterales bacterium]|nr:outer membrane protein assembly factor BamD [Vicinamibacterales bacterium]
MSWSSPARSLRFLALVLVVGLASACASGSRRGAPPGTSEPDKFLFDKGTEALNQKKWLTAREYFKQVVETYTSSPFRPDAKLGLADTYLGEGTSESIVLAINEYREFLSYYPTNHRADYAQYKIGLCHAHQMRAAQRDQTETRDAIKEFETFVERYPNSTLMPDVKAKLREAKDRLSEADYDVGYFYFRNRWYPGAVERLQTLVKDDPGYSHRDAAYFYLGESLIKLKRDAEALPYYEKLVKEFEQSEYLPDAQKRITELKAQQASKSPPPDR